MRIIRAGNPKKPIVEHTTQCPECQCTFAFTEEDIRKEERVAGKPGRTAVLKCPQQGCGNGIRVKLP